MQRQRALSSLKRITGTSSAVDLRCLTGGIEVGGLAGVSRARIEAETERCGQ